MPNRSGQKPGSLENTIAPQSDGPARADETVAPGTAAPAGLSETIAPSASDTGDVELRVVTSKDTARGAPDDTVAPTSSPYREAVVVGGTNRAASRSPAPNEQPMITVDLPQGPAGLNATIDSIPSLGSSGKSPAAGPPRPQVEGYTILSELGRGGMGVVYKARQRKLNRIVALKMVLAGVHAGQDQLARFYTEAEAVAHLQQPNIVQIYEVSEHNGLPYFSLEYVDGGSLSDRIDGQPQPVEEAGRMVELLARAIGYAHEQGIVHRDLKPANVLLTKAGDPKVTDFGLAKRLESDSSQTKSGTLMGTPNYMAPEQARGLVHEVGPLADVYALGVILYEMLTGRTPFLGSSILDTLQQVRNHEPVPPSRLQPKVPRDLETICLKCLEKEPAKRYETAIALADDLRRFLKHEPIQARPVGLPERVWRWCQRNRRVAALSAAVMLLIVSMAIGGPVAAVLIGQQKALAVKNEQAARTAQAAAEANQKMADASAKVAAEQRDLAFGAFRTFVTSVSKLRDTPATQNIKQQLLQGGIEGLQKVMKSAQSAGRTDIMMAEAHQQMGDLFQSMGQHAEARKEYETSYTIRKELADSAPSELERKRELAAALTKLGDISLLETNTEQAKKHYSAALALREELAAAPTSSEQVQIDLATSYVTLGNISEAAEAESYYEKALRIRREVATKASAASRASRERDVWIMSNKLADLSLRQDDLHKAREHFAVGLEQARKLKTMMPNSPRATIDLANAFVSLGKVNHQTGSATEAASCFDQALGHLRPAAAEDPQNIELQIALMLVLSRKGNCAEAAQQADQVRKAAPQNPLILYNIACCYALCAEAVGAGRLPEELPANDRAGQLEFIRNAIATLREAVSRGFKMKETLLSDPDLAAVRERPEFKKLLDEIKSF
jgi:eukaryotic-like serine/threonine-protein kinase